MWCAAGGVRIDLRGGPARLQQAWKELGDGLGLFIARILAREELDGDLVFLTKLKGPTEFRLFLPRSTACK